MSLIPEEKRDDYLRSTVARMDYFYKKLGTRARIDMFGKTEYYPIYQTTKMGIKTDAACQSSVQGLFAAGMAQASCATHLLNSTSAHAMARAGSQVEALLGSLRSICKQKSMRHK